MLMNENCGQSSIFMRSRRAEGMIEGRNSESNLLPEDWVESDGECSAYEISQPS